MARGRPLVGLALIDGLRAPRAARQRVRLVLATLTGQRSIVEACTALGVRRTRFYALRQQVLRGALDAAAPRSRGRPRARPVETAEVQQLQRRIRELELALRTTQLRSEIALTMPFLLDRAGRGKKGGPGQRASAAHSGRPARARPAARARR